MAFPRLNAVAFWLIPPAGILLISSYFVTGAAQSGWTAYPPLSITTPATGQIIWILSVLLLGGSSIFGGINFIATILKLRRPGLGLMQLPMYCWAMLGTSILVVLSTPVLAGTLVLRPAGGTVPPDDLLAPACLWATGAVLFALLVHRRRRTPRAPRGPAATTGLS